MRLIDADALKEELELSKYIIPNSLNTILNLEIIRCIEAIDNAPTVEKPTGEWIKTPELFRDRICSHCRKQIPYEQIGKFCIECGADMRKESTND